MISIPRLVPAQGADEGSSNDSLLKESALERKLAGMMQLDHCVTTGFARNALFLLLKALDLPAKSEIILPAFTCSILEVVIRLAGHCPVPVDAEKGGVNIDPDLIRKALSKKTRAIIVVHTYGIAASIGPICEIARSNGCFVIEDISHSLFVTSGDRMLGCYGDFALLSLTKKIRNFEGGAVCSNNSEVIAAIRSLRQEYYIPREWSWQSVGDRFLRYAGSSWEAGFSFSSLLMLKALDLCNDLFFKGNYGLTLDPSGFRMHTLPARIALGKLGGVRARAGQLHYRAGIPSAGKSLQRCCSFRTWRNPHEPGLFPRADFLYENYRVFSRIIRFNRD